MDGQSKHCTSSKRATKVASASRKWRAIGGAAANLQDRWRRLMAVGGITALRTDECVASISDRESIALARYRNQRLAGVDMILQTVETRFGACRGTLQQWLALSCEGLTTFRHPAQAGAGLHASQKSRSRRHDGSLPTHLQAGLSAT